MVDQLVNPVFSENKEKVLELLNSLPKGLRTSRRVLPNFLVLGPPKTATTSLHEYLKQHPDIYLPALKNPAFFVYEGQDRSFFGRNVINTIEGYYVLFQHHRAQKAIGEVSTGYLPDHSAPMRIHKHIPHARMITILRNPVERAFSQFCYNHQIGIERENDFQEALLIESSIMQGIKTDANPKYIRTGFYYRHLTRYYQFFDPAQLLILLYDDFEKDPLQEMKKIFSFLGVDSGFVPDISIRHNITKHPADGRPVLPGNTKDFLMDIYRDDILSLQKLISKDLSTWLD